MNWGGHFPHPVEDIDVFNRMPSSRQAEARATHELIRNNPHAQLFLIYDPVTRQPYPGQVLYSDIEKKLKESRRSLPEVPAGYKFGVLMESRVVCSLTATLRSRLRTKHFKSFLPL